MKPFFCLNVFNQENLIICHLKTHGTIKLKTVENGRVYAVTPGNDLVELFPDNDILADQV